VGPVPVSNKSIVEGGGLRAWGLAQGLAKNGVDVTVAVLESYEISKTEHESGVKICQWNFGNLGSLLERFDSVYVPYSHGDLMEFVASNLDKQKQLIVDLYVPIYIEVLARKIKGLVVEYEQYMNDLARWNKAFPRGDYFLCASEAQYHFYNGALSVMGRMNPKTFETKILDVVPYGIHNQSLVHEKNVCKGVLIEKSDFMVLWFGGLYPWFDIKPLLGAMKKISPDHPDIKLVILGGKNPFVTEKNFMQQYDFALEFAKKENMLDKNIFFIDWIPYEERNNWYMEADIVINLHHKTRETIYSWRTRIVDFIWGEVLILSTGGDEATEYLAKKNAAVLLNENTEEEIIEKIKDIFGKRELIAQIKKNLKKVKEEFYWERITKGLAGFVKSGKVSPDRKALLESKLSDKKENEANMGEKDKNVGYLIKMSAKILIRRGPRALIKKILNYKKNP
jgi:glycosyltransferase involved in cell wall biosynthesis